MALQNRTLGRFDLVGIPPAPRGVPQIEVTFDIDANGIVHVSAKDLGTGKEQKIRIESSSGLSEEEINKMVKDAEAHAAEDKKLRETAEARNQADNLIYATEKSLNDYGDRITADDKSKIEAAISDLKGVIESGDAEQIKSKTEALQQASYKLAEEVYKTAQGQQQEAQQETTDQQSAGAGGDGSGSETGDGGKTENVDDVDYEVVDEDEQQK
jgi:molecular chaperone DnaK